MKKILKALFGKSISKKHSGYSDNLSVLANAISDCGLWTWWDSDFPELFQIEFTRVMLYIEPKSIEVPPSNQIALRFLKPSSVILLKSEDFYLGNSWLTDFKDDKLEPFNIDYDNFTFNQNEVFDILNDAKNTEVLFSTELAGKANNNISLGFWANEVGIVIKAEDIKIISHSGVIELDEISVRSKKWWDYWQEYWNKIDTPQKLPYDALCEITIPAGKFKF